MSDRPSLIGLDAPTIPWAALRGRGVDKPQPQPTFTETMGASYRQAQADRLNNDEQAVIDGYGPLVTKLNELGRPVERYVYAARGAGQPINEDRVWSDIAEARERDPQAFAGVAKDRDTFRRETLEAYYRQTARDAATTARGGTIPNLIGGVGGTLTDWFNIGTMGVGGGGATAARRIVSEALVNAGAELAEQPLVAMERQKTGRALTVGEAATNVAFAGVGGAALQGVAEGAVSLAARARPMWNRLTEREREAVETLERRDAVAQASPFRPGRDTDQFIGRVEQAFQAAKAGGAAAIIPDTPPARPLNLNHAQAAALRAGRGEAEPVFKPWGSQHFFASEYEQRLARAESGGDWQIGAKTSSAYGRYQITRSTWLRHVRSLPAYADQGDDALWALRTNQGLQSTVLNRIMADGRAALDRMGVPETYGNLYLLHFAGEGGGGKVLRAAPDTPVRELLGAKAVEANAFLKDMTAGDLIGWAHRKMGDAPHDGPVLRRDAFDEGDGGDAAWRDAQRAVDAAEADAARWHDEPMPGFDDDAFAPPPRDADPFAGMDDPDPLAVGSDWEPDPASPGAPGERFARRALALEEAGTGEVKGALDHPAIGAIDVRWGEAGDGAKNWRGGGGLAHILAKHPEMREQLAELPARIRAMQVESNDGRTVRLYDATHRAGVRLDYDGADQRWLVTAYETGRDVPAAPVSTRDAAGDRASPDRGTDDDMRAQASGGKGEDGAIAGDAPGPAEPVRSAAAVEGFDHPDDVAAVRQMDSLEHDLRQFLEEEAGQGLQVRLNDEGDVVNAADALADVDNDARAVAAAENAWRTGTRDPLPTSAEDGEAIFLQPRLKEATDRINELREQATDRAWDRLRREEEGLIDEPRRRSLTAQLRKALIRREADHTDDDFFRSQIERALGSAYEASRLKRLRYSTRERLGGADFVRERLLQAQRQGHIGSDTVAFAEWFVRQNPALLDDLGISVRQAPEGDRASRGQYNPAARLMTLFKGQDASTTAVHEMLHHTERMMPTAYQTAIHAEWSKRVAALAASGDQPTQRFAAAIIEAQLHPTGERFNRALALMPDGDSYQFINPSEFWAVNATELLERRYERQGSVWGRMRGWLAEMAQHVRGVLRLSSDAPVLRALNQLLRDGDGRLSGEMLARATRYAELGPDRSGLGRVIPGLVKRGEIDAVRGNRMLALFDELEAHYRQSMGPDAAAAEASEATLRQLAQEARLKKRQTLLQIARQREILKDLDTYSGGASFAAVRATFDRDTNAPYGNVTIRAQAIVNDAHATIKDFLDRHHRGFFGQQRRASGLRNVVREMMGQDTGDAIAKTMAGGIAEVFERLRLRFNAAGGAIGKLDGWFPQKWSPLSVRQVSKDDFTDAMMLRLDRARMIDNRTGAPMNDAALRQMLGDIYQTIRTNGLTGDPSAALRGAGKLANQRAEHRVLHFKDADAWLEMNDRFGSERNPFNAINAHIESMAQDIAMMERLGPNPDATVRLMIDHVSKLKAAGEESDAILKVGGGKALTEKMYRFLKGEGRQLVHPDSLLFGPPIWVTRTVEGGKNLVTAMRLGRATLAAVADLNTQRMARGFNGLPQVSLLREYLDGIRGVDRQTAAELGLGLRNAAQSLATLQRWGVETERAGWTAVLADDVLRWSALNKVTEAGQHAFGLTALRALAGHRETGWSALPDTLRQGLERYGVDKFDWQGIRYSPRHIDTRGIERVKAGNISDAKTRGKVMDWVLGETAAAVQEASLTTRMAMWAGDRGSWSNLTFGTIMQFKAFGIGTMIEQGRRAISQGRVGGSLYAANLSIGATIIGAGIIQLRNLTDGKDPEPMDNTTFWVRASSTGGAAGYLGDAAADAYGTFASDRFDGVGDIAAGALGSTAADFYRAGRMAMPGHERADGTRREANPVGAALFLARRDTPGLSSLWETRAVWNELVIDQLAEQYDPNFAVNRAREAQRDAKNRQGRWLNNGEVRMPDWANALGGGDGEM